MVCWGVRIVVRPMGGRLDIGDRMTFNETFNGASILVLGIPSKSLPVEPCEWDGEAAVGGGGAIRVGR